MSDVSAQPPARKSDWILTEPALRRLLDWLDEGADSDGAKFVEMRRRLVSYFDRKNCSASDELADEALNRIARRLEEKGAIEGEAPARYCYIVARFVFLEYLRESKRKDLLMAAIERQRGSDQARPVDDPDSRERMLKCLEQCTRQPEPLNRELITRYYAGRERIKIENRRALAQSLGITMNALSIRACRIRDRLEACVQQCMK